MYVYYYIQASRGIVILFDIQPTSPRATINFILPAIIYQILSSINLVIEVKKVVSSDILTSLSSLSDFTMSPASQEVSEEAP